MNRISLIELNKDKQIAFAERPNVTFTLKKEIGRGASCIVYYAVGSDNTEHLLKEYYPKHLDLIRDSSGKIVVPADKANAYTLGLARFYNSCERQKTIRLSNEGLKNFTCNVQGYYRANGTEYIDMTCFNGQTYDKVQEKSVYNLILRMKTLAQVIGNYHNAGLLHLDIKPENIYVRPEGETIEDVMLFDFDSVTLADELLTEKALSYTKTWAAPEQLLPEKRRTICPATDLFALGEIIFAQLFGRHSTNAERRSFVTGYPYDHKAEIFKDMNPKVFPLLDDLLCHTICGVAGKRYQSAEELIAKLDEIIKIADPKEPYLKSSLPAMQDFFVGRDGEIQEIHRMLNENRILFLNGIGGIGKSELAKHYAAEHKGDYDAIIFAPYVSDVNMLLLNDNAIPLYNFAPYPEEKPEEYCARKLKKLRELCDDRTLFIVDNLDREDDPDLNKLLDLGCKLLITTRMDFSDYGYGTQLYLDAMRSRDSIFALFHKYYTKPLNAKENACVEQIIDLVAGHTMTVELLAKQMMAGRVTPEKMLTKLQEGGISESGKEKVRSGKDGTLSAQSTYAHIQTLFDISELDEDEKYILANLSLIPHTGISTELFHDWCELEDYECINRLVVEGWVRLDEEQDCISLHPALAEVFADTQLLEKCSKILMTNLVKTSKTLSTFSEDDRSKVVFVMSYFLWRITQRKLLSELTADCLRIVSSNIEYFVSPKFVKVCHIRALDIRIQLFGNQHFDVAMSYFHLGNIYKVDGDFSKAKEMLLMAKELFILLRGADYSYVFKCILHLGDLYQRMGQVGEAEQCYKQVFEYCINNQKNCLAVKQAFCVLYRKMGDFTKAIEYGESALSEVTGDPQRARIHSALGLAYNKAKDVRAAKRNLKKALEIRTRLYGDAHIKTALSYYRLGTLCEYERDIVQAKQYFQKAYIIRKNIWGEDHADTLAAKEDFVRTGLITTLSEVRDELFDHISDMDTKNKFKNFAFRECPDQIVAELCITKTGANDYDVSFVEIDGKKTKDNNGFSREAIPPELVGNRIVLVLESPHIEEYRETHEPGPAYGKTGRNIKAFLPHILAEAIRTKKMFEGEPTGRYKLILMNAIQYSCSLGVATEKYRDAMFLLSWKRDDVRNSFCNRLRRIYGNDGKCIVINCCTMGNHCKQLENNNGTFSSKYFQNLALIDPNLPSYELRVLVEQEIKNCLNLPRICRCDHPCRWFIPEITIQ